MAGSDNWVLGGIIAVALYFAFIHKSPEQKHASDLEKSLTHGGMFMSPHPTGGMGMIPEGPLGTPAQIQMALKMAGQPTGPLGPATAKFAGYADHPTWDPDYDVVLPWQPRKGAD